MIDQRQSHADAVSVLRGPAWCGGSCGSDFEVLPGVRHDLAVAGVVGSFDSNDAIADFRVLFAEIFGEFRLALAGPMIRISPASLTVFITCAKNSLSDPT